MKHYLQVFIWVCLMIGFAHITNAQSAYRVKSSGGANLRQGPSKDQNVVSAIPEGAKIRVVERTNDKWVKVEYEGKTGYIASELIEEDNRKEDQIRNKPANQTSAEPKKEQASSNTNAAQTNQQKSNSHNNKNNNNNKHNNKKSSGNSSGGSDYRWGIGLRFGEPTGITVKKYTPNRAAWEFNLGRSSRWGFHYDEDDFYKYNKYSDRDLYRFKDFYAGFTTTIQAHYLLHRPLGNAEGLKFYFGGGPQFRFTPITYQYYYNEFYVNGDDWWKNRYYIEERRTDIDFGLDGVLGLEYTFKNAPFSIFLDGNVFIEIVDAPMYIFGQSGLGVRYNF